MVLPLFNGNVGSDIAPLTPPVESLSVRGFDKGIDAAKDLPSTTESIVNGIKGAVATSQQQKINEQTIEKNDAVLQTTASPEAVALEKQKIEADRDALARETKIRQQRDELMTTLQSGDDQSKVDAVTSGRFADVFAADPKLEEYATKVAIPGMTTEQRDAFSKREYDKTYRDLMMRHDQAIAADQEKTEARLLADENTNRLTNDNPEYNGNLPQLLDDTEFVLQGTYDRGPDGSVVRDPNTGLPKKNARSIEDFDQGKLSYQAVSKKSGKILGENIPKDTITNVQNWRATSIRAKKITRGGNPDVLDTVKEAQRRLGEDRPQAAPTPKNTSQGDVVAVQRQMTDLGTFASQIAQAPLTDNGKIAIKQNGAAVAGLVADTLGVSPEAAARIAPAFKDVVSAAHEEAAAILAPKQAETRRQEQIDKFRQREEAKDKLTRGVLGVEFEENQETLGKIYTEDRVKDHNKAAKRYQELSRQLDRAGAGAMPSLDDERETLRRQLYNDGTWDEVATPLDFFVIKNRSRIGSRIDAILDTVTETARRQLASSVNSSDVRAATLNALKSIK